MTQAPGLGWSGPVSRFVSYAECRVAALALSHCSPNWFPNGKMIMWLYAHHFFISSSMKVLQYNISFWGQCFLISFRMLAWLWLGTGSTLICLARDIQTNLLPYFRLSMKNWIMNTPPLLHCYPTSTRYRARRGEWQIGYRGGNHKHLNGPRQHYFTGHVIRWADNGANCC